MNTTYSKGHLRKIVLSHFEIEMLKAIVQRTNLSGSEWYSERNVRDLYTILASIKTYEESPIKRKISEVLK